MRAGIALGSNIEPRLEYMQAAFRRLFDLQSGNLHLLCSRVYETSPVGCPPKSPRFLNAVLELLTNLEPEELFWKLKGIEMDLGRSPLAARNSPRTIDLDLLYCDNITLSTANLIVPHPQMTRRGFVLRPLADIRPHLILPNSTKSVQEMLHELQSDEILDEYSVLLSGPQHTEKCFSNSKIACYTSPLGCDR